MTPLKLFAAAALVVTIAGVWCHGYNVARGSSNPWSALVVLPSMLINLSVILS